MLNYFSGVSGMQLFFFNWLGVEDLFVWTFSLSFMIYIKKGFIDIIIYFFAVEEYNIKGIFHRIVQNLWHAISFSIFRSYRMVINLNQTMFSTIKWLCLWYMHNIRYVEIRQNSRTLYDYINSSVILGKLIIPFSIFYKGVVENFFPFKIS